MSFETKLMSKIIIKLHWKEEGEILNFHGSKLNLEAKIKKWINMVIASSYLQLKQCYIVNEKSAADFE